jgi:hypothetical protein
MASVRYVAGLALLVRLLARAEGGMVQVEQSRHGAATRAPKDLREGAAGKAHEHRHGHARIGLVRGARRPTGMVSVGSRAYELSALTLTLLAAGDALLRGKWRHP